MDWNTYFLKLAVTASFKSKDPNTKCGCVIADSKNRIVSIGFNGPSRNVRDELIPVNRPDSSDKPHKLQFFFHAELNAILSACTSLDNHIAYISGKPCLTCTQLLYHVGIRKIFYTDYSKPSSVHYPKDSFDIFFQAIKEPLELIFISIDDI